MTSRVMAWLRFLLILVLVGSVLGQLLIPLIAADEGQRAPEVSHLVVPYSVAGILAVACLQAAVACIWALLGMVESGRIYTRRSLRWVEAIAWCGGLAAAICAATAAHLVGWEGIGGPGVILGGVAAVVAGGAFVLLMIVMRGLLAIAIADRSELAEVI
ncbi:MAG: DUF2975 domain-containing protein [Actinomycetes bacterium]